MQRIRHRLKVNWGSIAPLRLDPMDIPPEVEMKAGLGFAIPYLHNGEPHEYLPDFIVRLNGDEARYLILETKGYDPLAEVKAQAADRWVHAVNSDGAYGSWDYALVSDMGTIGEVIIRATDATGSYAKSHIPSVD